MVELPASVWLTPPPPLALADSRCHSGRMSVPLLPRDTSIWKLQAALKCGSCKKGRCASPVHMIKLTQEREIAPSVWVQPTRRGEGHRRNGPSAGRADAVGSYLAGLGQSKRHGLKIPRSTMDLADGWGPTAFGEGVGHRQDNPALISPQKPH
jgi:hypothetical protein